MATEKQKKAIANVVENGGNVSKAMRDAGYSHETAKNPNKLTGSKSWEELMDENFGDEKIQSLIEEGLYADKPAGEQGTVPDYPTRHKYIDTVMKLKDKYPAQKKAVDLTSGGEKLSISFDDVFKDR